MACAPPSVLPAPAASKIFSGMMRVFHATPLPPMPLLPAAPMMPATCVPCPRSSIGLASLPAKSHPFTSSAYPLPSSSMPLPAISPGFRHRFPFRSACVRSTPVSTTATIVCPVPVAAFHPRGALMAANPHCEPTDGSDATACGAMRVAGVARSSSRSTVSERVFNGCRDCGAMMDPDACAGSEGECGRTAYEKVEQP